MEHPKATKLQLLWLYGTFLSLAYELPLVYLSTMDRLNPRFFDVMFVLGIVFVLPGLHYKVSFHRCFQIWRTIVVYFCFCALIWGLALVEFEYGKYSLFFAGKYIEGLLVTYIALKIPLTAKQKQMIMYMITLGGVFVAIYSIPEYFMGARDIEYAPGKFFHVPAGQILGPLGHTYFHVAFFSSIAFLITLVLAGVSAGFHRAFLIGTAFFVMWPTLFCGSRAALALIAIGFPLLLYFSRLGGKLVLVLMILVGTAGIAFQDSTKSSVDAEASHTLQRLQEMESERFDGSETSGNSIRERLLLFLSFNLADYMWEGWPMPFIGAGFYIAPISASSGEFFYRIGYGVHNSYLFAFEQGGIVVFILFLYFLFILGKSINKMRREGGHPIDVAFALGTLCFFYGMLFVCMVGQSFWIDASTNNLNAFLLLIFFFAIKPTPADPDLAAKDQPRVIGK